MEKARVLLDTNILVSGLVFAKGNEHKILRLIEDQQITMVLPHTVLVEAEKVLAEKFPGFERLLNIFLDKIEFETVPLNHILSTLENCVGKVSDNKDASIYAAIILTRSDYAFTGDKILRRDLKSSSEITSKTKVYSSKEFLVEFKSAD